MNNMDNTDVNVFKFKGEDTFMTFTDFHLATEMDFKTLRTIGSQQHKDHMPTLSAFSSSHPGFHTDSATGELLLVNWLG